jgi:hypothetical protein
MRQPRSKEGGERRANFRTRWSQKDCLISLPIKENEYATT